MVEISYEDALVKSIEYFKGEELPAKVFLDKYALRNERGELLEETPDDMHKRLAREFARIEKKYPNPMSEDEIFDLIKNFEYIIPQGSPMSAIGNPYHIQSSGNCFTIKPPYDSYGGIFYTDQQLAQLMKRRCVSSTSYVNIKGKGNIKIKNAKIDDEILSFNTCKNISEYKKIKDIFKSNVDKEDRITITLSNGTILNTSKKHPVLIFCDGEYKYIPCLNLKEDDVLIKPEVNSNYSDMFEFDKKLTDIGWFIGCHMGDGTASKNKTRIRCLGDNEIVVAKYAEVANSLTDSTAQYKKSTKRIYKSVVWEYNNNKKTVDNMLVKYIDNQRGKKTYNGHIPSFIRENNLWIPFLAGIIDSDGYIRQYGSISVSMCMKEMIDELSVFLSSYGVRHHVQTRYPRRGNEQIIYRLNIHVENNLLDIIKSYLYHDKKIEKINSRIGREFSHIYYISDFEKEQIVEKYENQKKSINTLKTKQSKDEAKSRKNLSVIISNIKKGDNPGVGALNIFLKYDLISQKKYSEIMQRVFVKKIEKDEVTTEYIDIEVADNNNFYAGNFGLVNIHNCGVGVSLNPLRPKGSSVKNAAKTTDGIGVFMERYSNTCREVAQNGRRGAEILILSVHHPEIQTFINIKKNRQKVTGANISIQMTDEFMEAVINNDEFELRWPVEGTPVMTQKIKAREIWDNFIESSWDNAEPGVLNWSTVIKNSVSNCYGKVDDAFYDTACNPCGEIVMGTDSCRLLAINLYSFVKNKFTSEAFFDFDDFSVKVGKAQRMMDDMVDLEIELIQRILDKVDSDPEPNNIKSIEKETWENLLEVCKKGRRTGLGITGLGDTIASLGIIYGSPESIEITESIYKNLCLNAYKETCLMARDRGTFPIFSYDIEKDVPFINKVMSESDEVRELYLKYGRRNVAITTTPPAGSISVLAQVTSGIEPVFMVKYKRRKKVNPNDMNVRVDFVDQSGDAWQEFEVYHKGFKDWMEITGRENIEESPYNKATSNDIDWEASVDLQAAAQKWVCHAISKTCNLPSSATKELVEKVYLRAWEKGCKGFTVYRDGCRTGVLVSDKKEDKEENNKIAKTQAIKRPQKLPCDVYRATVKGEKYFVIIGHISDEPYEVFAGKIIDDNFDIKQSIKNGYVEKMKRGKYALITEDGEVLLDSISDAIDNEEEAVTRLISSNLRHGCDVGFIVHQLEKTRGDLLGFAKAVSRILKKYVKDGTKVHGEVCKECGANLIRVEGCITCLSCGWSKCG